MPQNEGGEHASDLPATLGAPARRALATAAYTRLAQLRQALRADAAIRYNRSISAV